MFYIDSVLLLKERLLIISDFNVHVEVPGYEKIQNSKIAQGGPVLF